MRSRRFLLPLLAGCLALPVFGPVAPAQAQAAQAQTMPAAKRPAPERFEKTIAEYEAADRKEFPVPGGVLFIGSSSIRLWTTLAHDFPELHVLNRGFGGSIIFESTQYIPRIVQPYKPRMIVIYAGSNDIAMGLTPEQVRQDFETFVTTVHAVLPETRIAFISINPSVKRWEQEERILEANRQIADYIRVQAAKGNKLTYLDSHAKLLSSDGKPRPELLRKDGLHLNADGYAAWTAILKPQILELATKER